MIAPRDRLPPGLHLVRPLGPPLSERWVWQAETADGTAVAVKFVHNPWTIGRLPWLTTMIDRLHASSYPVPRILRHAPIGEGWFVMVLAWVPGTSPTHLNDVLLERLVELIQVHAATDSGSDGWDVSEWIDNVVFDEWEDWWQSAMTAAPVLTHRLRLFVEPAPGTHLPRNDLVHHDFNLSNILVQQGAVTGVVDWEAAGRGSRALDFATLLFEWHRLRHAAAQVAPDGGVRLVEQIVGVAGNAGLRLVVTFAAIARLALTSRRSQFAELAAWQHAIADLLDSLT